MAAPGRIVVLNGAPRAGKSAIAAAMQARLEGIWVNLGVDVHMRATPQSLHPGIGLRPGGERPDLETHLPVLYAALYESIAAHARLGLNVVADLGHHDSYSRPLGILADCARRLAGLEALLVGVDCDLGTVLARRAASGYPADEAMALRWQAAVDAPGIYDLRIDGAATAPEAAADAIAGALADPPRPSAFMRLAGL